MVSLTALTLAATTTQRQIAEEALRQRVKDLAKLNDSSQTFLGIFDTHTIYDTVSRFAVEKFELNAAWIEIRNGNESKRSIIAPYKISENQIDEINAFIATQSVSTETDISKSFTLTTKGLSGSVALLPLKFAGRQIGQLDIMSFNPFFFNTDREILLDSYANLAAVAIQNTWLLDQVKSGNERLHALSHRLMEVQESERLHLSRELHDESGQVISAMMVQLGLLERDAENPELITKHANELKHIAADVLKQFARNGSTIATRKPGSSRSGHCP